MSSASRDRVRRERAIRRLASRQHGLIHRDQALRLGLSGSGIHRRVESGAWVRLYRCVYGIAGAPETFEQRALATCLAAGRDATLSHSSAGEMWGFCNGSGRLHVTVQGSVTTEPPGVVVHRTGSFRSGDRGKLRGVPVTSPVRTLIDLAAVLPERELEKALYRAVTDGRVASERLRERVMLDSCRGRRGPAVLRNLLPECPRASHVPTPLEDLVGEKLRAAGFPGFVREYAVYDRGRAHYVDFAFPDERVAIEADGRRWHSDADAFEKDRLKQNTLTARGWKVIRITDRQVRNDPDAVTALVQDLVGADAGNRDWRRPVLDRTSNENEDT